MDDIYVKRQAQKQAIETFRERARRLFPNVSVEERAHVQLMENGAFVEVIVWVPNEEKPDEM